MVNSSRSFSHARAFTGTSGPVAQRPVAQRLAIVERTIVTDC